MSAQRPEDAGPPERIRWVRYVPHERVESYLRLGWMIPGRLHDARNQHWYAITLVWPCSCRMVEPAQTTEKEPT